MMDKQIIIDGVDVSGCVRLQDDNISCELGGKCKGWDNCYYKNWQHKEQECEKLKLDLIEAKAHSDYLNNLALSETLNLVSEQLDQFKTENDSLKKQLQFEFDETLLQYSNIIEDLQKQLNNTVMRKCPQCGEVYLNPVGCELYEENQQLKAELEQEQALKETYLACYKAKHEDIKGELFKLRQTLQEIKEYFIKECEICKEQYAITDENCADCQAQQILQKISEVIKDE